MNLPLYPGENQEQDLNIVRGCGAILQLCSNPWDQAPEGTIRHGSIIKTIFQEKIKYACNCLKHENNQKIYFHNFKVGQHVLEFGQRNGKMYYEIQKYILKKYSGTGPRVIVTLGPTSYSK